MTFLDLVFEAESLPCKGPDPELWFQDDKDTEDARAETALAVSLCRKCPIRHDCLANAGTHGVWGGYTAAERESMRLNMKAAA